MINGPGTCTTLLIVGALVLIFLTWSEVSRMNIQQKNGTCGAGVTKIPPTSAKKSNQHAIKKKTPTEEYVHLDEHWQNDVSDENKHQEMKQNEEALAPMFTWEADEEDNKKFDDVKVDPQRALRSANTKGISPDVVQEKPRFTKRLGMPNPMAQLYHSKTDGDEIKFDRNCSWFLTTDAYHSARADVMQCDCLREDCEACK